MALVMLATMIFACENSLVGMSEKGRSEWTEFYLFLGVLAVPMGVILWLFLNMFKASDSED